METANYLALFGAGMTMVIFIMTISYLAAVLFYHVEDR
jgi:hypothetical protein